jgi:DNA-binding HxlR family transcriptional regulator
VTSEHPAGGRALDVAARTHYAGGVSDKRPRRRAYHQFCGAARALDVVGERWTLLIVRDLLLGPRRYTDLLEALPGITTNLLAKRLKEMTEADLIRRETLPGAVRTDVYSLTERGLGLEPVVVALGRWGLALMSGSSRWWSSWGAGASRSWTAATATTPPTRAGRCCR